MHLMWLFCHVLACCVTVWGLCCIALCALCAMCLTQFAAWSCPPVTRMTSTYPTWTTWRAAPHLYVTSPRSPHSETGRCVTSILRSGERRTKNFCGLSTVSVLSYVIYFNAQEELIFFYLFIAPQGLFCLSFCNIFFHITKVRDYMPFYWDSSALEHLTIQTVIEIFLVNL